jgi:hypothetical protein
VRQTFDDQVERDLREVVKISHFYSRFVSHKIVEMSYKTQQPYEERNNPTNIIMALHQAFDTPNLLKAIELIRQVDERKYSTKEMLNMLTSIIETK